MRKILCYLSALIVFASVTTSQFVAASDWPTYAGNNQHTGYVDASLANGATELWSASPSTFKINGLVAADSIVVTSPFSYFETNAPIIALDLATGAERWRRSYSNVYSVNQPTIDVPKHHVVYQTGNHESDTYLRVHDSRTGQFIYRLAHAAQWDRYLSPLIVGDQIFYQGGIYGGLYLANDATASMIWFSGQQQYESWAPTTWSDPTSVIGYTNQIMIINTADGSNRATINDPAYNWSGYTVGQAPIIVGDHAYVTNGGTIVDYDLTRLTVAGHYGTGASGQIATDGTSLFTIEAGALVVRSPQGAFQWSAEAANGNLVSPIIVFKSHVVAAGSNGAVIIDRSTHQPVQVLRASGLLAYANDKLIIGLVTGETIAYSLPSILFKDDFE